LIAADTSSVIAFLTGEAGDDVQRIETAMRAGVFRLPPPVITELLIKGDPARVSDLVEDAPELPLMDGYWTRVGLMRRLLFGKGLKAAFADALIAQCCVDADVPLISRDRDYRHFERWCGLKLAT
jgi:predicted nucleic acid-binding protein